jgi:putative transcriptional regulator
MTAKTNKKVSPLSKTILSTAGGLHRHGIMDKRAYEKIVADLGAAAPAVTKPITAKEIRTLRESAKISQAVFARCLNVTTDYVSKLERGAKRPTGSTLVLLNVIQRNGIELVL